jgi:hypothetical protein
MIFCLSKCVLMGVDMHKNTILYLMIAEFWEIYVLNQIVLLEAHYIRPLSHIAIYV